MMWTDLLIAGVIAVFAWAIAHTLTRKGGGKRPKR